MVLTPHNRRRQDINITCDSLSPINLPLDERDVGLDELIASVN